jgi:hypothetical protein
MPFSIANASKRGRVISCEPASIAPFITQLP